ncbi:MAG TPA: hypothetical protein VKT31_13625 [Solirubrobacteraceae bacterium]|nr:hypothetical protein [Solirubrobacteraceae bacterium]
MRACCPAAHGCNAQGGREACALDVCRAAAPQLREAALALKRWDALQAAWDGDSERERRFQRRAYQRARDSALIAIALEPAAQPTRQRRHGRRRRGRPQSSSAVAGRR